MKKRTQPDTPLNAEPHIVDVLDDAATALWNSHRGQVLVAMTHPSLHRLLAAYFTDIVELTTLHCKIRAGESRGEDMMVTEMGGQGMVLHPIQKMKAATEKRLRDAEKRLGLTPDALRGSASETATPAEDRGF